MKLLLTGNSFHGYDNDLREALLELGHTVDFLPHNIHGPFNTRADFGKKLAYGVLPAKFNVPFFVNRSVEAYNRKLIELTNKTAYDLVVFIGAKTVTEQTLDHIRSPKVLWFMDGIRFYPKVEPLLRKFDHVFFFEPTDTSDQQEALKNRCSTLHLGFNPKRFFPTNTHRNYAFSFVGSYYPNRDELLKAVVQPEFSGIIIGDFRRSAYEEVKQLNTQQQISISQVNELYNATQININVHHKQSIEGLNVRTFEIQGSGNLQLVERQKVAVELFRDEENILLYDSVEEFRDKMRYYLNHPEQQQFLRANAYTNALQFHTWKHRMEQLLNELQQRHVL